MANFNVMVPIMWTGGSTNRFRVPVKFDGEINAASIAKIKKLATDYVISRGQELAPYSKIEIYRQNPSGR
jgi:hypothetical protein